MAQRHSQSRHTNEFKNVTIFCSMSERDLAELRARNQRIAERVRLEEEDRARRHHKKISHNSSPQKVVVPSKKKSVPKKKR